jgi:HSP20 family protein
MATKEFVLFEPGALMRRVLRDADRYFGERATPVMRAERRNLGEFPWVPEMEMFERDGRVIVRVDLPGMTREEVSVTATPDGLRIEGERRQETEEKENEWYSTERIYGRFLRTVPFPDGTDPAGVKATFTNGVLEVSVPLPTVAAVPTPHKVPIEGAGEPKTVKAA